ncbi:MAG: hypothetical protein ACOC55_01340 [Candidatus Natronoplasma sp.]
MPEVNVKIPPGLSEKIVKFELERELTKKSWRLKSIKASIDKLNLSEEDIEKFEDAREEAWRERKNELL